MATARDRYNDKAYSEPLDKGRAAAAAADMAEADREEFWGVTDAERYWPDRRYVPPVDG